MLTPSSGKSNTKIRNIDNLKVVEETMNITLRREVVTALNVSCVGTTLDVGDFFKINHPVCKADYSMELHCCLVGLAQRYKTAYTFWSHTQFAE